MQINLIYDSSTQGAPAGFFTAMAAAAQYLDSLITNNIIVNIQVGWGESGGQSLGSGVLGEGGGYGTILSYSQVKSDLLANSNSAADANLPTTGPSNGAGLLVSLAQEKAWGLVSANGTEVDGVVGFSSSTNWNFSTNNTAVAGQYTFLADALHELTHALGRDSGLNAGSPFTVMDLFQYASPGVIQTQVGGASYFSINGGATNLANFATTSDLSDWSNTVPNDSFDAFLSAGTANPVSSTDITLMNVLGFQVASQTNTAPNPAPVATTVQQEILGLYAALYNRAADSPGLTYWEGVVNAQPDSGGVTAATAASTAVTAHDAQLLGQLFVASQSSYFNATYGSLTDSQFVSAVYNHIGGNSGDPAGITYWSGVLATLEAQGVGAQMARSEIIGQFVQIIIEDNLSTQPPSLTTADWQAAAQLQTLFDNKIAVSLAYANASAGPGGAILDAHSITDAAYQAATRAIQNVTADGTTAVTAIGHIQAALANHDLTLI